jgi:hypothetical protein
MRKFEHDFQVERTGLTRKLKKAGFILNEKGFWYLVDGIEKSTIKESIKAETCIEEKVEEEEAQGQFLELSDFIDDNTLTIKKGAEFYPIISSYLNWLSKREGKFQRQILNQSILEYGNRTTKYSFKTYLRELNTRQ